MKIAGIDIGTTSICGIILDTDSGKVLRNVTENSNAFISDCASFERIQSVDTIILKATNILKDFAKEGIDAIGVTGQMHGIVYTDDEGNCVSPLYTWQDERGNEPYGDTTYAEYMSSFSGYGAVTDFYNRENGIRPLCATAYCTIHDYFVMKLCSLKTPVIHDTNYASFGKEVTHNCAKAMSGFVLAGTFEGIPVSVAIGDNQASVFSTLADEDCVLVNVGTGSQVSIVSDKPINTESVETRPYFDGKYLAVGAALCGGRAYSLLKDFYSRVYSYIMPLEDDGVYGIMNKMLMKNPVPLNTDTRFAGTRSNKDITGSVEGITESNFTPEALTAGVLCGMTKELHDMYISMGAEKKGIVASGNGIRKNPALVKYTEEIFGYSIKIPRHQEEAAYGAALYAGVAAGIFRNSHEAHKLIGYEE